MNTAPNEPDFRAIEACFDAALAIAPEQRRAWLDERRRAEPDLVAEVESLLERHECAPDWLEGTADHAAAQAVQSMILLRDPRVGATVGRYAIDSVIAAGGMGTVYCARDTLDSERPVALKIVHPGAATDEVVARFRRESEVLASLDHPGIARFLANGLTGDGDPFYAMELIDGEPITDACDRSNLPLDDRLELFCRVCDAVQAAHENAIVHRDLKPGNILVDRGGNPRVIDFGIAKILAEPTVAATATKILTPEYASPEQVRGEAAHPSSDVYSLAVVLYELLTGRTPYRFASHHPSEVLATVADPRVEAPSRRIEAGDGEFAEKRSIKIPAWRRRLAGDVDRIVLYALRLEPERRYATAGNLAADIRAHLAGQRILARPDTAWYRARRYYRRHRLAVSLSAGIVTALALGTVGTLHQMGRANHQSLLTQQQVENNAAILRILLDIFDGDTVGPNPDMTVRAFVDRAVDRLERSGGTAPAILAYIYEALGRMYHHVSAYDAATSMFEKAIALRAESAEQGLDERHQTIRARGNLGAAHLRAGRIDAAFEILRGALSEIRAAGGDMLRGDIAMSLAAAEGSFGDIEASKSLFEEALEARRRALGDDHCDTAAAMNNLATACFHSHDEERAEDLLRAALAIHRRSEDRPRTARALHNLGMLLAGRDDIVGARAALTESVAICVDLHGPHHDHVAGGHYALGMIESAAHDFEAAAACFRRTAEIQDRNEPGSWHSADTRSRLGECLIELGALDAGRAMLEASYATLREQLGDDHEHTREAAARLQHALGH